MRFRQVIQLDLGFFFPEYAIRAVVWAHDVTRSDIKVISVEAPETSPQTISIVFDVIERAPDEFEVKQAGAALGIAYAFAGTLALALGVTGLAIWHIEPVFQAVSTVGESTVATTENVVSGLGIIALIVAMILGYKAYSTKGVTA